MRRQKKSTTAKAVSYQTKGSMRVDPFDLNSYFHSSDLRDKAVCLSGCDHAALFDGLSSGLVQIKQDFVLVECHLSSGLPLVVRVPLAYYEGVGARFIISEEDGNPVICLLELVHRDPSLTVPLAVTTDLEDAAIDWQSWQNRTNLPMLHWPAGSDGYQPVEGRMPGRGALVLQDPAPRRHHSQFAQRRPRFLVRRKTGGGMAQLPNVKGREIIARN